MPLIVWSVQLNQEDQKASEPPQTFQYVLFSLDVCVCSFDLSPF